MFAIIFVTCSDFTQGLEEVDLLLLRGHIHQLQLPCYRPVQDLQDSHLDVGHQSRLFRHSNRRPTASHIRWAWCDGS
jgi:hypothetical protein